MVKEIFHTLLDELGHVMQIPDLHPDRHHSCLIRLPNGLGLQIEIDSQMQFLTIGCDLGSVPTGRYRENVFREALKANGLPTPHHGILAYSTKSDHLVLFSQLHVKELSGQKIADEIAPFSEKALLWKSALEHGEVPTTSSIHTSSGMFGLRP